MSDVLKNPKRNKQEIKKNRYVPEYKKYGIIPNNFSESKVIVIPNSKKNINTKLDKIVSSNNTLPQLFTSNKMQNNKDYVDPYNSEIEFYTAETNIQEDNYESNDPSETVTSDTDDDSSQSDDASYDELNDTDSLADDGDDSVDLKEDDSDRCILIVDNDIISISSFEDIQFQVESLIFGTHPKFNKLIQAEAIKVYRRLNIKVGVFLE